MVTPPPKRQNFWPFPLLPIFHAHRSNSAPKLGKEIIQPQTIRELRPGQWRFYRFPEDHKRENVVPINYKKCVGVLRLRLISNFLYTLHMCFCNYLQLFSKFALQCAHNLGRYMCVYPAVMTRCHHDALIECERRYQI